MNKKIIALKVLRYVFIVSGSAAILLALSYILVECSKYEEGTAERALDLLKNDTIYLELCDSTEVAHNEFKEFSEQIKYAEKLNNEGQKIYQQKMNKYFDAQDRQFEYRNSVFKQVNDSIRSRNKQFKQRTARK